ncbi:cellular communication network factor 1, like 2 [Pangasianodon hypophthalmus]|uniref:cellular communication network factor 1, like 2 n=1 Tax=Pangasianodon hypophthalmus TaxID=310915 RepID=UPI002307923A|nr:cellular communication network factor 1, like 2 [Pangasianodon hypophthalmus]
MFSPRSGRMQAVVCSVLLFTLSAAGEVMRGCSGPCSCPLTPPSCPVGVSLVLDECGCCKVCAQQFNQDCGLDKPCDYIKGLRCHLGAGGDPQRGLCRADTQGRPCEFGGRVYQHSEDFQPSCEHQCSCMDGVVGCMPLCPHRVPLPAWHCANPRLETPPGRCCEEWVCDDDNRINEAPRDSPPAQPHVNHINKLLHTFMERSGDAFQEWTSLSVSRVPFPSSKCVPQTTDWSECSASCGFGISSRVTNTNPQCKLVRETRLCQIHKCDTVLAVGKGKKCRRTLRSREPEHISFGGCTTVRRYRPKTCGSCTDGRCCRPSETRTVRLRFRCPDGESITHNVMWIQRCHCSKSYCSANGDNSPPSVILHNDIHTFSH